jgi:hypothetical protein
MLTLVVGDAEHLAQPSGRLGGGDVQLRAHVDCYDGRSAV